MDRPGGKACALLRDSEGSLTVEALLVLPILLVLMVLFVRWGLMLKEDLADAADSRQAPSFAQGAVQESGYAGDGSQEESGGGGSWFLFGGKPARRIRDADTIIDLGQAIRDKLPQWFLPSGS